ncbi:WD40 repeat domain-containing protein [Methanofollis fontis]|uniref:Pyrrolo-quinoline quinone repeat domain-containing protein n=1 Tax=Methanofollis fontis TaxID=2052832 RepID=A0A483CQZ7_9EURY|nr:PQQ-binding-like beta-propeller repeat protein [Methanofollis fontis]TAJ45238.1 hypothetical protein CUJ86_00340 [Methanofollis fontis]
MRRTAGIVLLLLSVMAAGAGAAPWTTAWQKGTAEAAIDVALSGDGRTVAVLNGPALTLYDATGSLLWEAPASHAGSVDISTDGSLIVAGGENLRAYHRDGEIAFRHDTGFFALGSGISPDGSTIAAGFDNSSLMIFRQDSNGSFEAAHILTTPADVTTLDLAMNGSHIVTGDREGFIRYYTGEGRLLWSYKTGSDLLSLVITDDGSRIIAGMDHGVVGLLTANGREAWKQTAGDRMPAVAIAGDGTVAAIGADGITVHSISEDTEESVGTTGVTALSLSADGSGMAAAFENRSVALVTIGEESTPAVTTPQGRTETTPSTPPRTETDAIPPTDAAPSPALIVAALGGAVLLALKRR